MKSFLFPFFCLSFIFTSTASSAQEKIDVRDSLALVDFYNNTQGAGWYNHDHWMEGAVNTWFGVLITDGRVSGLQLRFNNLTGTLPASLNNLNELSYLDLTGNVLSGKIPASVCDLTKLTYLDLSSNYFTSALPSSIGNLVNLQYFYANDNRLCGSLPQSIGNLKSLCHLYLQGNHISGTLPSSIGNLSKLINLVLFNNQLSGQIPESIGNLSNLYYLLAWNNRLSGRLPESLGNLTSINDIDIDNNNLSGRIPLSLTKLTQLNALILHDNHLSGRIPAEIGNMSGLQTLYLSGNALTGEIPPAIGNAAALRVLHLENNELSGIIPFSIGRLTNLAEMDLSFNLLTGKIPESISHLSNLYNLYLTNNQLSGSIPNAFYEMPNLQQLYLHHNQLSGDLPESLDHHAELYIDVSYNRLSASHNFRTRYTHFDTHINLSSNDYNFNGIEFMPAEFPDPVYGPQAPVSIHRLGVKLTISVGGTLANNTYEWFSVETGSGSLRITGDSTFRPGKTGSYFAKITNALAPQLTLMTDTFYYQLRNETITSQTVFTVYPNPAQNILSLNGLSEDSDARITITDMSGYIWLTIMSRRQQSIKCNVSKLKAGNYLVNVNDGKTLQQMQFLKQ